MHVHIFSSSTQVCADARAAGTMPPPLLGCCLLWLMFLNGARTASQEAQEAQEAQLTLLYRRLLLETAPRQLELQDALGITWRSGFLIGSAVRSQVRTRNALAGPRAGHLGRHGPSGVHFGGGT